MAYERVAITDTPTPSPASAIPTMREERVVEYKSQRHAPIAPPSAPPPTPSGQPNINSEAETAEGLAKPAESVTLSPQMAALARREQRFRANEQAFKAKEAALEAERKEIEEFWSLGQKVLQLGAEQPEHTIKHEVFLAGVRECVSTWVEEANA